MSSTLKAFVAKLKSRRKSRLWRQRRPGRVYEEDGGEDAKILTKEMAGLSITSTDGDAKTYDADSPIPHIFGRPNFKHDFELPAVYQTWPGPSYDEKSQFAPGIFDKPRHPKRRPRQKSSKRRLSHDERPVTQRRDERAASHVVKAVPRITRTSRQPQYYGSPPARDPPNHLLNLPGEIRNEVYRMLCLSDEPIFAQFRVVIKPRQGRSDKAHTIRRLPREPAVALVCHQIQREALSLFYSENKFIFHKSENPNFSGTPSPLAMTRNESITKWTPRSGFAEYLQHMELHFRAREPTFKTFCIAYTFSKSCDKKFRVVSDVDDHGYCTCFEKRELQRFRSVELEGEHGYENLLQVAAKFSLERRLALQADVSMSAEFPYTIYRPTRGICDDCGLEHLREIGSGT